MPHEKINHDRYRANFQRAINQSNIDSSTQLKHSLDSLRELVVAWHEGWVQVQIYPWGWNDTGDALIVDLNPQELDLLIKTLKRAKKNAYVGASRAYGFEDGPKLHTESLFE